MLATAFDLRQSGRAVRTFPFRSLETGRRGSRAALGVNPSATGQTRPFDLVECLPVCCHSQYVFPRQTVYCLYEEREHDVTAIPRCSTLRLELTWRFPRKF
jgi:hypothetical protein